MAEKLKIDPQNAPNCSKPIKLHYNCIHLPN